MESQPQNPEFRNNPENFHPCRQFKTFIFTMCCQLILKSIGKVHLVFLWSLVLICKATHITDTSNFEQVSTNS